MDRETHDPTTAGDRPRLPAPEGRSVAPAERRALLDPRRLGGAGRGGRLLGALLIAFVASLAVGYFGYQRFAAASTPPAPNTVAVRRGSLAATVNVAGSVVATRQAKLLFGVSGRIKSVDVKTGDAVAAGQVLATLDPAPFELKIRQAESALKTAQIKKDQLAEGATPEDIAAAEAAYNSAVAKYNDVVAGSPAADVRAAQAAYAAAVANLADLQRGPTAADVTAAQSAVDAAVAKLNDLQKGPTAADLQAAEAGIDSARAAQQSAVAKLDQLKAGPVFADVQAARQAVTSAETTLTKSRNDLGTLQKPPSNDELMVAKADLESKRIALQQAQAAYDRVAWRGDVGIRPEAGALEQATIAYQAALANYNVKNAAPSSFELSSAQSAITSAQASVDSARAKLAQVMDGPTDADLQAAQSSVDSGLATLRSAEAKLATLTQGPTNADLQSARNAVDSAEAKLATLLQGPTPGGLQTAQSNVESARSKLETLTRGPLQADVASAQSAIKTAESSLSTKTTGPKSSDLALAAETIVQAQITLDSAKQDLESTTLKAPYGGVIGPIAGNPGEQASATTALMTLIDPKAVRIDVAIDESSLGKVVVGKAAEIRFEALPEVALTGRVVAISPSATVDQGVVTYLTSIQVDPGETNLPAGMTANVSIIVDQVNDTLVVPSRAVRRQGQSQVVDVYANGRTETRPVRTGLTNDQSTQIVDGVNPGEQVVVAGTSTQQPRVGGPGGEGGPGGGGGGGAALPIPGAGGAAGGH